MKFVRVKGLTLSDLHINDYYSNVFDYSTVTVSEENDHEFVALRVVFSEEVSVLNFSLTNSYREGIEFWKSKNISVDNFQSTNVRIYTQISFWLSEDVSFKNSFIDETGSTAKCSTVNWVVKNALMQNNRLLGGRGIDIGNEAGIPFLSENNSIEDNYVTVGIYIVGRNELRTKNLSIKRNEFISTSPEHHYVIQIASVDGLTNRR